MNIENTFGNLLEKIKYFLEKTGFPKFIIEQVDSVIYILLILLIAFVVGELMYIGCVKISHRILKQRNFAFLSKLIEYNALRKTSFIIPPIIITSFLPIAFANKPHLLVFLENTTWIYFIIMLIRSVSAILSSIGSIAYTNKKYHDRPIKGFIQVTKIIIYLLSTIFIISIITNKTPFYLIGGLGAFAAVLMLVFKDTIMGFVGGILLLENDMMRLGDWIEVPNSAINGIVTDISLTIVKVQNFDNTIITIPPYTLISESFINWHAMSDSGGRRIMRGYTIKTDSIKTCTSNFLEKMKGYDKELKNFIVAMQKRDENTDEKTMTKEEYTYGTIDSNLGLFRAYMTLYLKKHPSLNKKMLIMVRTLTPTEYGLPLQIYCFTSDTKWSHYESIQSEIMEHVATTLPKFGLLLYQSSSSHDSIINGLIERGFPLEKITKIPAGIL